MKTKFLNSILLAVASLALFIPTQVWAQNYDKVDFVVDGIAYSFLSDGTVSVVPIERFSLSNYEELDKADLVIPGYVTYRGQQYRVSRIGALSFKQNSEMFGLYLDDSESIGISKVTIPATVDVVEKDAFSNPNKLNTNLHTVVIEGPNTEIQSGAFSDNPNLTEVIAPNTFSPMGFNGTPWYNLWYDSQPDGVLYYGTQAVGYKGDAPADSTIVLRPGTTAIGKYCFSPYKWLKSIEIPSTVTVIDAYAFRSCTNLQDITIPESVTSIGDNAFYYCKNLQEITIPESVTSIGDYAFYYCSNLQSITNIEKVPNLGYYALHETAWLKQQGGGLVYLGTTAYCYKGTTSSNSITVKEGTTTIAASCFSGLSNLTTVVLPSTLKTIGVNAFNNCKALHNVSCASNNAHFASHDGVLFTKDMSTLLIFPNAHATTYTIPSTVAHIADYAFGYCDELEEVELPSGLATIGYGAFSGCTSLKKVSIPASVGIMKSVAFSGCTSMAEVHFEPGSQLTSIASYSFQGCSRLRTINIPSAVEIFGLYAFSDCDSLRSIKLPTQLQKVGARAFYSWNNNEKYQAANSEPFAVGGLQGELVIPSKVKYVGSNGFGYNFGLTSVKMEEGVKEIIWNAFYHCHSLKEVYLPSTISHIYSGAFSSCDSLQLVRCAAPDPTTMKTYPSSTYAFSKAIFGTCVLQVPKGSAALYRATAPWSSFAHIEEFEVVLPGDVNGDKVVSGADVTALYNVLLDGAEAGGDADVNGDGVISGADVTALYNLLLN